MVQVKKVRRLIAKVMLFVLLFAQGVTYQSTKADAGEFAIRNSPPDKNNKYYYDSSYNANAGSSTYKMPNCTTYVLGRVYEITGSRFNISGNAKDYFGNNTSYASSTNAYEPALGAVVCYTSSGYGHVQVVEEIGEDSGGRYICVSESNLGGRETPSRAFNYLKIYLSDLANSTSSGKVYIKWLEDNDGYSSSQEVNWNLFYANFQGYIYPSGKAETNNDNSPIVDSSFFYDSGTESITTTGARIDASFASTQSNATSMGFYLGTDANNMQKYSESNSSNVKMIFYYLGDGKWTQPLSPNTTYCYKLWAVVNGRTYETTINSFTTKAESGATVDTSFFYDSGVESITDTGARIDASFSSTQSNATSMGFYLGTDANNMKMYSETNSSRVNMIFYYLGTGKWTEALTPGTTYYYKLWSKVNGVLYETPVASFTTTGTNPNADTTPPVISDVQVVIDCQGYTVSCVVTDNVGVDYVQFPVWTDYNGQDDLIWELGTESYGVYSCRVNYSAHNNEEGAYYTHIYAYDSSGNCAQGAADTVNVYISDLHSYTGWNINLPATCTASGSQSRSCSICGHTETQSMEAIGHTDDGTGVCIGCGEILVAKITSVNLSVTSQDRNTISMKMDVKLNTTADVEYKWTANNTTSGNSYTIKDWTKSQSSVDWLPPEFGEYNVTVEARVANNTSSTATKTMTVYFNPHIKGKCQMPYWGEGGGFLIGVESYENPNQSYQYEMLILDCTLLAEGKPAWVYTTNKFTVTEGAAGWCVWQPQYGYYWTLFRVYDAAGNMIDQACYPFVNAY